MAATFNTFRLPPQIPEFIPYNGPPKPTPTSRRHNRNGAPSNSEEWPGIDEVLATTPESKARSKNKGVLTPTMRMAQVCGLLYSDDNKGDSGVGVPSPSIEGIDANLDYLFEGSSLENPVIVEDDPADTSPEDSGADADLDGGQREHLEGFDHITDGQARSSGSNHDLGVTGQLPLAQQKRKRSQSAGSDTSTVQMLDLASDQSLENFRMAKRQRALPPQGHKSGPNSTSTSEPDPLAAHNDGNPQIDNPDDENATNDEGNDTSVPTSNKSNINNRERGGDHEGYDHTRGNKLLEPAAGPTSSPRPPSGFRHNSEEPCRVEGRAEDDDRVSDDNGSRVGTAAAAQQPKPATPHLPGDGMLKSDINIKSRRPRAKLTRQRKSSSSDPVGITAKSAGQRRSFRHIKSRRNNRLGLGYKAAKSAGSNADGAFTSPSLPALSTTIGTKGLSNNNDVGQSPQRHARHKLTDITLRPVSSGVSFLAAIIQTDRNMPELSCSEPAMLVENALSHVGKVDDVTIKPLRQDLWLVTGFLHGLRDTSELPAGRTAIRPSDIYSSDARSITRTLHGKAADVVPVDSEDDPRSSDEDDSSSRHDLSFSARDDRYPSHKDKRPTARIRIPWSELDEQRLLAYKKEDKPWEWIFRQFPKRTPGAVKLRWHMLQLKAK